MSVIVTDDGFAPDDWDGEIIGMQIGATATAKALHVDPGVDVALLADHIRARSPSLIRIGFPSFADGRGLTLARTLRAVGFEGRLRAAGHVLADQYAMMRRSGFDEIEIDDALARRQDAAQWKARADWRARDYQVRLGRRPSLHRV